MVKDENKIGLAFLAIILLVMIAGLKSPTFILYGGQEIQAELTNETGECWTLGMNDCARRPVNLLRLLGPRNESGLLICPELYYSTQIDCRKAFGFIEEVPEPKLDCFFAQDDVCYKEQFEEQCPTLYFTSLDACQESLIDFAYSAKVLFSSRKTLIMVGIGAIALLFIIINFLRKR